MPAVHSIQSLAVYCGSSPGNDPIFYETAYALGQHLACQGIALVYGGGSVGLMGAVADGVLSGGGKVVGVITRLLNIKELAHPGISEMHVVETMHERKALMAQLSGGFLALPGGFGTLDELCEVLTWSQLGIVSHPIGLLNLKNYFSPFITCLETMEESGFLGPRDRNRLLVGTDFASLLENMSHWQAPEGLKLEDLVRMRTVG